MTHSLEQQPTIEIIQSDQWGTPDALYNKLNDEFKFEFDACATKHNTKCKEFSSDIQDHVKYDMYYDSYWMNPPYSRGNIDLCMQAAVELSRYATVVTLTRFDPTTEWFKKYVDGVATEVRMLARRVKFLGAKDSYNFPCCVSVYHGITNVDTNYYIWDWR